jgi:hypothetical protein
VFAEVKAMLTFITGNDYDEKIVREIRACVLDLTRTAEIVLPGEVNITITEQPATTSEPERVIITDTSTVTDDLVIATIATWCDMRIGNPPNYDNLLKAYESLKGQLRLSKNYSTYGDGGEDG